LDASDDLLTRAPAQIPIALSVFSNKAENKVGFNQGRAAIAAELAVLRGGRKALPKGERGTALWDSVLDALEMFGTPHLGDVIYSITDGEDNESKHDYRKVEQALASSGVRLFAFLPRGELTGPQDLREAVAMTGGLSVTFRGIISPLLVLFTGPGGGSLPQPLHDALYREMAVFYRLDVELPEAVDKPRDWDLKLEAPGKNKKGWNLVYPRELMPCAAGR